MAENKEEAAPQSAYQKLLEELPRTGPGTRAGEMLRRYWHPVCLSAGLKDIPVAVRMLSEDLVLFRDGKGSPGLLGIRCPHRLASLEYGQVREDGLMSLGLGCRLDDGPVYGAGRYTLTKLGFFTETKTAAAGLVSR